MYDKRSMFEAVDVGIALDLFSKTPEGAYLVQRAKREILAGMYQLKDCDPTDVKAIMAAQGRVRVAESFKSWLEEGIEAGIQAHRNLQDEIENGYGQDGFEGQDEYPQYEQDEEQS
jgi:hypothetical protein